MGQATAVFDDDITGQGPRRTGYYEGYLKNLNEVSEVLGPGRLSRAKELLISVGADGIGVLAVQGSHHQDFPGTPADLGSINTIDGTVLHNLSGMYPFIRLKVTTAIAGNNGAKVQAKGTR